MTVDVLWMSVNTGEVVQYSVLIAGFHHNYLVVEFLSLYQS